MHASKRNHNHMKRGNINHLLYINSSHQNKCKIVKFLRVHQGTMDNYLRYRPQHTQGFGDVLREKAAGVLTCL